MRLGTTGDVAGLVAFLCSEEASYIIGQTIVVDGGSNALSSANPDFHGHVGPQRGLGYVTGA